jgi:hypothetical protein
VQKVEASLREGKSTVFDPLHVNNADHADSRNRCFLVRLFLPLIDLPLSDNYLSFAPFFLRRELSKTRVSQNIMAGVAFSIYF